uniref:Uncharacterized protein n=1 Tax=Setaria viridis TaxID=4556 RepID=A0A4U6V2J6_SETVI|nr:hypothetical protein SEVIR_4G284300v2 [Setaria viridis]
MGWVGRLNCSTGQPSQSAQLVLLPLLGSSGAKQPNHSRPPAPLPPARPLRRPPSSAQTSPATCRLLASRSGLRARVRFAAVRPTPDSRCLPSTETESPRPCLVALLPTESSNRYVILVRSAKVMGQVKMTLCLTRTVSAVFLLWRACCRLMEIGEMLAA